MQRRFAYIRFDSIYHQPLPADKPFPSIKQLSNQSKIPLSRITPHLQPIAQYPHSSNLFSFLYFDTSPLLWWVTNLSHPKINQ